MDTNEFLRLVLPRGGLKVLAVPHTFVDKETQKPRTGWKYHTYQGIDSMAEAALQLDAAGKTVYFATQGYGDWYEDTDGKRRLRTQENVIACRSLFDDFDVDPEDPKKYRTREAALADIRRLATELRLTPTVTSSGGGFHVYFTLDADITPEAWMAMAQHKRDITTYLGMKVDRAVDMDTARILRPVGTHNRKTDVARPVVLLKQGKKYDHDTVALRLAEYVEQYNVPPAIAPSRGAMANPFAAALGDYPPSSALRIIERCSALREVAEAKGDVAEPLWRAMLGLVKHTIEGDALCHEWSAGHPEYDADDTQRKLDAWSRGPTLCTQFDQHTQCAAACPHSATVRTPIRLGYLEEAHNAEEAPAPVLKADPDNVPGKTLAGVFVPHFPEGFQWNGRVLMRRETTEDGVQWTPFSFTLLYPVQRVRTEDGTWALVIQSLEHNGDWRTFTLATADLAAGDTLAKSLAQHEVFLVPGKKSRGFMMQYLTDYTLALQENRVGTITVQRLGWAKDFDGYVIGDTCITADKDVPVICGGDVPSDSRGDFGRAGTLMEWVRGIDRIMNRSGGELMQFVLCHALGAPLVELFGASNWHGLPLVLVGESGQGKSTISKIGCGAFGAPGMFERQANADGSTIGAAIKRISGFNSLPLIYDELSGRKYEEITRIGYALANGRDKERLTSGGQFATVGTEWFTNSIASSNESIQDILTRNPTQFKNEAVQLRFFEIRVPNGYLADTLVGVSKDEVDTFMDGQYGHAGREYIRFLIRNKDWVRAQISRARNKLNPRSTEETKERFYRDCITTAMVAGKIAAKIGLINFDVTRMVHWALDQVNVLRDTRANLRIDPREHLAQYIASLHGRTITTKRYAEGHTAFAMEVPIDPIRGEAVARVATEDQRMFIARKSISDWCREHDVPASIIRDEMLAQGLIIYDKNGKVSRVMRLGKGTTHASSLTRCYELSYSAILGSGVAVHAVRQPTPMETEHAAAD